MNRRNFASVALLAPVVPAIAIPAAAATCPMERARRAWAEFSAAMDDLSAGGDGWKIMSGYHLRPSWPVPGGRGMRAVLVRYERDTEPRCPSLIVERHEEIAL